MIALTPHAPIAPTDVEFSFAGTTASAVAKLTGINTLLFSASATPVADIVALAATLSNDGVVNIPGTNGTGAFAVATVNVGASASITASADTGSASLPVNISLCQTDPATGQCISAIGPSVTTQINANATPTFGIFVEGNGNVPLIRQRTNLCAVQRRRQCDARFHQRGGQDAVGWCSVTLTELFRLLNSQRWIEVGFCCPYSNICEGGFYDSIERVCQTVVDSSSGDTHPFWLCFSP